MKPELYLLEDGVSREWHPFSLTRPVGEILFGTLLLRERIERAFRGPAAGYLAPKDLEGFREENAPPIAAGETMSTTGPRILLASRYLPVDSAVGEGASSLGLPVPLPGGGHRLLVGDRPAGWLLPAGAPLPGRELLEGTNGAAVPFPALQLPGSLLETPWALLEANPERISLDLTHGITGADGRARPLPELPQVHRVGEHTVTAGEGVVLDPLVVLDTREGPIHLGDRVHLHSFTTLRGPAFIGKGSTLLGGVFESLACGPVCRLRGEISATLILGYANKSHDGYIGHSLLGRWVNLGAFTTNSDLKNNYGPVRVAAPVGEIETGLLKLGVFMGDHAKTGIGTFLNAGTIVGAGSNIYGGRFPWKWIPPFGWGTADAFGPYRLEPFLATVERAMGRRGIALGAGERDFLARAWGSVHAPEREREER
ncbi:MAG: putative sugar nucleotidyl transferase [Gemmatimonadota bacterium]